MLENRERAGRGGQGDRVEGDRERTAGRGSLSRVCDVHVLRVAGSHYEMGYQHGELLADEIRRGPIPYFRTIVEKLMGRGMLGPASTLVWPMIQRTVGRRVAKQLPAFALETMEGIADGAGLERQLFIDGCTMPDSLMWVAARFMRLKGSGPAVAHRLSLDLGCTSAMAWGSATRDGAMLHARNFDYHGVAPWAGNKAVIFHEPNEGQRYASVAAAGVALGGVTAMNEAGLTLTVHQHMFTDRTKLGGVPIGLVGDIVMREARDLQDAQEILDAHTPIGCWTYNITDGKTNEVLCYEENPDRAVAIRRGGEDGGTFGYANIYLDEELGRTEVDTYGSYWRHNEGRHRRVNELLEARAGTLDSEEMAAILGDTGSRPECRVRDSIAMVMTVGSVVFRPSDGVFWVGTGEAPTSHGEFIPFSLDANGPDASLPSMWIGGPLDAPGREAFDRFRRAFVAYVDEENIAGAREHIALACELAPTQPIYHALAGLFAINQVDAVGAEDAFDRAIELGHPDEERRASLHLWRARARDLDGRRDAAIADYRTSLGLRADPPVRKAALRGLKRPYGPRRARAMHVDVGLGDVVAP